MGLPYMPISWGGARGVNGAIYGYSLEVQTPLTRPRRRLTCGPGGEPHGEAVALPLKKKRVPFRVHVRETFLIFSQ